MSSLLKTMQVSGAVAAYGTTSIYTAPADGYAIVNVLAAIGGNNSTTQVTVGGQPVMQGFRSSNGYVNSSNNPGDSGSNQQPQFYSAQGIYVGPGQTIAAPSGAYVTGVEFKNVLIT